MKLTQEQAYALEDLEQATDGLRNHQFSVTRKMYAENVLEAIEVAEELLSPKIVTSFLETHLQKHLTNF